MGPKLSTKLNKRNKDNCKQTPPNRNRGSIFFRPTDCDEIYKHIIYKHINAMENKAGVVDGIKGKTLKILSQFICLLLQHIFNLSIEKAIWPNALKNAEVVPIYKVGDKSRMSNYRPISLICNIGKVFQKIIFNRLYNFLMKHDIISEKQFGFVKNRGTTTHIA